jgi:hypothetical protein
MSGAPPLDGAQSTLASGVIEIAALTALLGSTTAESLVLGSNGASGIVWACISIFGIYAVIKGCIGAVTPSWLRETIGVRDSMIEQTVGSKFDLLAKNISHRFKLGTAIGIQTTVKKVGLTFHYLLAWALTWPRMSLAAPSMTSKPSPDTMSTSSTESLRGASAQCVRT